MPFTTENNSALMMDPNPTQTLPEETPKGMDCNGNNVEVTSLALDSEEDVESPTISTIEEELEKQSNAAFIIRILIGLVFVAFVIAVIADSATNQYILNAVEEFLQWVEDNPVEGFFASVIVYFAATVLFIPGSLLTLGLGFVFATAFGFAGGVALATLAVFVGASSGAIAAFLLGRYLLRQQMLKLTKKYTILAALDAALDTKGLRIFILLRLSPIIPFNVINYVAGVTSVSFRDYCLSLFAILPGTILYCFLGASAGSLTESATNDGDTTVTIIVSVVGVVFGFLAIFFTTRYAKAELNRLQEERRQAEGDGEQEPEGETVPHPEEGREQDPEVESVEAGVDEATGV